MKDKIFTSLVKYAKKDKIIGLHISYFNKGNLYQHNYGYADKNEISLINNQTLFEIGSVTKPIIATIYSILQQKKVLSIDSPVSSFFKSNVVHPVFARITIKDLLTHTAGLPRIPDAFVANMTNQHDPYACLTTDDLHQYLKTPTQLKKKGTYHYSNLGYGILGEIIRIATLKPIDEISKEVLFNELGMHSTNIIGKFENMENVARGHNFLNEETGYWHNEVLAGAGCFLSCGDDMAKYMLGNIHSDGTGLSESIHYTHVPYTKKIGLAWHFKNSFLSKILGYNGYIWHNGMTGGFSSFVCFHKKKKLALVLLANKAAPLDSYFHNFASYNIV